VSQVSPVAHGHVAELDGLRGLAIGLVLVWHDVVGLVQTTAGSPSAYAMRALSLTWAGVDLFFVLSGFLIGGILLDNRNSSRYFSTFYVRRACRVFPLYYAVLALFLLGTSLLPWQDLVEWQAWIFGNASPGWAYATFLQNFTMIDSGLGANGMAVTWSLAIEEQFYLVAPMLVRSSPKRVLPYVLASLVVVAVLVRIALYTWAADPGMASFVLLPARWDSLFLGMLAAWLWREPQAINRLRSAAPVIRAVVFVAGGVTAVLLTANQNIGSFGMAAGGYTVIAIGCLGVILLAMVGDGLVQQFFRLRPLVWLGTISYGVYLFHRPMTGFMHGLLLGQPPRITNVADATVTLLALGCTLALAEVSARVFERPIVNLGRRLARY